MPRSVSPQPPVDPDAAPRAPSHLAGLPSGSEHLPPRSPEGLTPRVRWVVDRGARPHARGWFHLVAAFAAVVSGTVLSTYAWIFLTWWQALGVTVYAVGFFQLFAVSAAYHRGPWGSDRTLAWWKRADHATIGVFIAATYTPLCLIVLPPVLAATMLGIAWLGAGAVVVLTMVWVNHPRVIDPVIFVLLGWLVVPLIPELWRGAGAAVVWLLFAGGVVYTAGAVLYALRWPGREARWYGFHEHFHAATIVAAVLHLVAVWMVVVGAAGSVC